MKIWKRFVAALSLWALLGASAPAMATVYHTADGAPVSATVRLCDRGDSVATSYPGGWESGPVTVTATPSSSSHAAGVSVGGLLSVPLARTNGGSGIITGLSWKSVGGFAGSLVLRVWVKKPVNTTCTDNVNFAGSDVDDAFLITIPFSITTSAPLNTTGDASTYGTAAGLSFDYKNLDAPLTQMVYVCAVTNATDTADENNTVRITLSGPQN